MTSTCILDVTPPTNQSLNFDIHFDKGAVPTPGIDLRIHGAGPFQKGPKLPIRAIYDLHSAC